MIGASGKTGRLVTGRLIAAGRRVRPASRSSETRFDWNDEATWLPALSGVSSAYITYHPDLAFPGAADTVGKFADLAVASRLNPGNPCRDDGESLNSYGRVNAQQRIPPSGCTRQAGCRGSDQGSGFAVGEGLTEDESIPGTVGPRRAERSRSRGPRRPVHDQDGPVVGAAARRRVLRRRAR